MEPKIDGFQKESPIPRYHFQVPCWTLGVGLLLLCPPDSPKKLMAAPCHPDFRPFHPPLFGENVICSLWLAIKSPLIIGDTASSLSIHTVDGSEIQNNHLGSIKPCQWWDILPSSTGEFTGFLPPTVLIFRGIIQNALQRIDTTLFGTLMGQTELLSSYWPLPSNHHH